MKKNIFVIAILSLSLFGCSNFERNSLASTYEIESFFTSRLSMSQPSKSYNFSVKMDYSDVSSEGSQKESVDVKGRVTYGYETSNTYYKGSYKSSSISYDGIVEKDVKSIKEEGTVLNENTFYVDQKVVRTSNDLKQENHYKHIYNLSSTTTSFSLSSEIIEVIPSFSFESFLSLENIEDLYNLKVYIEGNDCLIIDTTESYQHECEIYFDEYNYFEKIVIRQKDANLTSEIVFEFGDVESIYAPSNTSDYKYIY